ncbi:hypothetical protein [Roseibium sp.]|uniref:hypothetical protein n=1 Tax=Roseibium sp. TaxID=1936156 RepID=UPI003BB08B98
MLKLQISILFLAVTFGQSAYAQKAPDFEIPFIVEVKGDSQTTERIYDDQTGETYFAKICAVSIPSPDKVDFKVIYGKKNFVLHPGDCHAFRRTGSISIFVNNSSGKTLSFKGNLELTFN